MKKYILYLITIIFCNTVTSQVLYTENFNNLTVGTVSNDATGTTPGQGGWFTQGGVPADYSIATEPGKGNILRFEPITATMTYRDVFRTDLAIHWQQRTAGNNVLKFAFDFYIDDNDNEYSTTNTDIVLFDKNNKLLVGYEYRLSIRSLTVSIRDKPNGTSAGYLFLNGQRLVLSKNMWLTFEMYLDYDNSKVYYSIPALNYTVAYSTIPLDPGGHSENDGVPVKLLIRNEKKFNGSNNSNYTLKYDNINFSAQNTVPVVTVGTDEVLANSFNLYPNPANNVVNITNNENRLVNKIEVYDTTGKLINSQSFNEQTELQLNVENLASGTYMLHLKTNEGTAVKKLVKK